MQPPKRIPNCPAPTSKKMKHGGKGEMQATQLSEETKDLIRTFVIKKITMNNKITNESLGIQRQSLDGFRQLIRKKIFVPQYKEQVSDLIWAIIAEHKELYPDEVDAERTENTGRGKEKILLWEADSMHRSGWKVSKGNTLNDYCILKQTAARAHEALERHSRVAHDDGESVQITTGGIHEVTRALNTASGQGAALLVRAAMLHLMWQGKVFGNMEWATGWNMKDATEEAVRRKQMTTNQEAELMNWWDTTTCRGSNKNEKPTIAKRPAQERKENNDTQGKAGQVKEKPSSSLEDHPEGIFIDFFSGWQSARNSAKCLNRHYISVDISPWFYDQKKVFYTDVTIDLLSLPTGTWVDHACEEAKVKREQVTECWFSIPCDTFTPTDSGNTAKDDGKRKCGFRDFATKTREPIDWKEFAETGQGTEYGNTAREHDKLAEATADEIQTGLKNHEAWFVENPRGSLMQRPYWQPINAWMSVIHYCVYFGLTMKPTCIWTNANWISRGPKNIGDGSGCCNKNGRCEHGAIGKKLWTWKHFEGMGGAGKTALKGETTAETEKLKNQVPILLIDEIMHDRITYGTLKRPATEKEKQANRIKKPQRPRAKRQSKNNRPSGLLTALLLL